MSWDKKPTFASFWFGKTMPAYERACVRSFTARGYDFTVYSYHPISNLPEGAKQGDASAIADCEYLNAFVVNGRASLSHFTDYFRYSLFGKTDEIWVDVDIVLLGDRFEVSNWSTIAGYETDNSICGAVLKLDKSDPHLGTTLEYVKKIAGQPMAWGATGPRLLTKVYGSAMSEQALPTHVFYPLNYTEYFKFLLPEFLDECRERCQKALTLHLWNNSIDKAGVWKEIGPPKGSFLNEVFTRCGADGLFDRFYPESIMRTMLQNEWFYGGPTAGFKISTRLVRRNFIDAVRRQLGQADLGPWER